MQVFLCWSGDRSKAFAKAVKDMLEVVSENKISASTSVEIEKGTFWFEELRNELSGAKAGVICLTHESLDSG